jgi:TolC family type I secretion outer membrane protein
MCVCGALLLSAACAKNPPEISPNQYVAPSQDKAPAEKDGVTIEPKFDGRPENIPTEHRPRPGMGLAELVDVALTNSPMTRIAWAQARGAAANWGSSRSEYYPSLTGEVDAVVGDVSLPQFGQGRSYVALGATLSYLLLDFGGREARVEAARQALIAANWSHDQAIQNVLRDVPQAYYTYLGDRAQVKAAEKNLQDAQTTLRSTEARKKSGVSTIADVLQAKSGASQAKADLAARNGSSKISKGTLATVVGWQANAPFDIAKEPSKLPVKKMANSVDALIEESKQSRPDIGAAQAQVRQKEAELKDARTLPFPKLSAGGTFQWQKFRNGDSRQTYAGLKIEVPIFAGFSMQNAIRAARAELDAARAELTKREDDVIKEVWDAYHNFNSAAEQFMAFNALLTSAQESYNASLARYKEGVAEIVELLNAQNVLASARAQLIESRMALYSTHAELMHAVGKQFASSTRRNDTAYIQE